MARNRERIYNKGGKYYGRYYDQKTKSGKYPTKLLSDETEVTYKLTSKGFVERSAKEQSLILEHLYQSKKQSSPKPHPRKNFLVQFSPSTQKTYQTTFDHLDKSGTTDPVQFMTYLKDQGFTDRTVQKHLTTLKQFYNWCLENRTLESMPKFPKVTVTKKQPRVFSDDDIETLIHHIWLQYSKRLDVRYWQHLRIVMCLKETGMRRSEVYALRLEHILLEDRIIRIMDVPELQVKVKSRAEQSIPISERFASFLEQDLSKRSETGTWYLDSGTGKHFYSSPDKLTQAIQRHLKSLGLNYAKALHGFRASLLTKVANRNPLHAQIVARHSDISTTIRNYVNPTELGVKDTLDSL